MQPFVTTIKKTRSFITVPCFINTEFHNRAVFHKHGIYFLNVTLNSFKVNNQPSRHLIVQSQQLK